MLRTADYKYVLYDKGKGREQLFRMDRDRLERYNLAGRKRYREQLEEHRELLRAWMKEQGVKPTRKISQDVPPAR